MATKFGSMITYCDPTRKVTWPFDLLVLQDHLTNYKQYMFTTRVAMATKLSRMVAYLDGLFTIKSHYPLVQTKAKLKPYLYY